MGAEGAIEVIFRREIDAASDKDAARAEFAALYRDTFASPYVAAGRRLVDSVIEPAETRRYIATALEAINVFERRDGRWYMVHHQAGPVFVQQPPQ